MGATDTTGRLAASIFGMCPTEPFFEPCLDIAGGGVLLGLPGLLSMGVLSHSELFTLPPGYYRLDSIFMLLAFMALARIKTSFKKQRNARAERLFSVTGLPTQNVLVL